MVIERDKEEQTVFSRTCEINFDKACLLFTNPDALVLAGPKSPKGTMTYYIKCDVEELGGPIICHFKRPFRRRFSIISLRYFTNELASQYDFSAAEKNPYIEPKKEQLTIRLDPEALEYFMNLAKEKNEKYQTLINKYLLFCAQTGFNLPASWEPPKKNIR